MNPTFEIFSREYRPGRKVLRLPVFALTKNRLLRLLLQPLIEIFLRLHFKISSHVVVAQAAQLRADDFVLADLCRCKVHRNIKHEHKILLTAQCTNVKRMAHVLFMHHQRNGLVHRNYQRRRNDVVARLHIIRGIEPKEVLVAFIDLVGMQWTKFSVRSGITKIKTKLLSLDLDRKSVSGSLLEVDLRPGIFAENSKGQDFRAHESDRGYNDGFRATGQMRRLPPILLVAKDRHKSGEHQLSRNKRDTGFGHRL